VGFPEVNQMLFARILLVFYGDFGEAVSYSLVLGLVNWA